MVVQSDAVGELPTGARPIVRPVRSGSRRAVAGLRPVGRADVVHGLDVDLPIGSRSPLVTTVHDLAVFDVPDAFSSFRAAGERRLVARAIRRADEVIAVSRFTAERIEHHFGRSATVTALAPPDRGPPVDTGPSATAELRARYGLPERFVLQVATIEPRKDGVLLARVCRRLGLPLVLAGAVAPGCRVPPSALHIGRVPDHDRERLMATADIVAYISRYEGFGLPPIEAMAQGRPVVASTVGGLPDVVDDGALLVGVDDEDGLERNLRGLWCDDEARRELGRAGRAAAERLSWQATAEATLAVYRRLGVSL